MTGELAALLDAELATVAPPPIAAFGRRLAEEKGAVAVLFYGSALRTGDLDGVLDFYLLTERPHRSGLRGLVERWLWPEVSYHERRLEGRILRAKAATLSLAVFRRAAEGRHLDTTIWARFVQPAALVWARDELAAGEVRAAVVAAARTAGLYAAALGPPAGPAPAFWQALFRRTYRAEVRIEPPGREAQILAYEPQRWARLLPAAWTAAGLAYEAQGDELAAGLSPPSRRRLRRGWALRQQAGKALGAARLAKATFTFEGAARYAAWKIERHTGVRIALTPWRERHPLLAAPIALWPLLSAKRRRP